MKLFKALILLFFVAPLVIGAPSEATSLVLDAPTTRLDGSTINAGDNLNFTFYCGYTSGDQSFVYNSSTNSVTFNTFLPADGTFYCTATASALDNTGTLKESGHSNEVNFTIAGGVVPDPLRPVAPGNLRLQ